MLRSVTLAVTSAKRSALMPQLPTVAELGLKGLEQEVLYLVPPFGRYSPVTGYRDNGWCHDKTY